MKLRTDHLSKLNPTTKRELLIECLSHIQDFVGSIVVIKYGGSAMVQEPYKDSFTADVVLLQTLGMLPVIIHGGGPEVSKTIEKLGLETSFIDGLRITDLEGLKVSEMVLSGTINKDIISHLSKHGGNGVGISGKDGNLILAKKLNHPKTDLGYVGEIQEIHPELIITLLDKGYIPVISPIASGKEGSTFNINADIVASRVGVALNAKKIIFLTDVSGVLKEEQLISQMSIQETRNLIDSGVISGGMIPKIEGMLYALENGVTSAHIISGMDHHALISELFTIKGTGTMITN